jgi:hypothetical protein
MLLRKIKNDPILSQYIREECEDEGICVNLDSRISKEDFLIIKVDDYYNDLPHVVPKSPDCLIIQRCKEGGYAITIVELKSSNDARRFNSNILQKFETCLYDFIDNRFRFIFDYNYDFKRIELLFISKVNVFGSANVDNSLILRIFRQKEFEFRGKKTKKITAKMPNTIIKPCY